MVKMNQLMAYKNDHLNIQKIALPKKLNDILADGVIEKDSIFFLKKSTESQSNLSVSDFFDNIEFECTINSIHIRDYVEVNHLLYTFCFVEAVFQKWINTYSKVLTAILTLDDMGVNIKFHKKRENQSWLADNLEGYAEAIMSIDSSDINFFDKLKMTTK